MAWKNTKSSKEERQSSSPPSALQGWCWRGFGAVPLPDTLRHEHIDGAELLWVTGLVFTFLELMFHLLGAELLLLTGLLFTFLNSSGSQGSCSTFLGLRMRRFAQWKKAQLLRIPPHRHLAPVGTPGQGCVCHRHWEAPRGRSRPWIWCHTSLGHGLSWESKVRADSNCISLLAGEVSFWPTHLPGLPNVSGQHGTKRE